MEFIDLTNRLIEIDRKILSATQAVVADEGATSDLEAAMKDLERKSKSVIEEINQAQQAVPGPIADLEELADKAKVRADAERNIDEQTRRLVVDAHGTISSVKANLKAA